MTMALGLLAVLLLTAATGYFVAQEFAYVAVDRGRLRQLADDGDAQAERALRITSELSFALSGAQFGITVTALLVGYVSEPLIGVGLAELLEFTGWPEAARLSVALTAVLVFSTVVQMVFGELAPKNLAIARPVPLARALSRSTALYLAVAGPVVRLFDRASTALLRSVGIEPVEELAQGATAEDLARIIEESRESGALDQELSGLLDRGLRFRDLVAEQVMTPRVDVTCVEAPEPVSALLDLLRQGHSRFPVTGEDVDDVLGVVGVAEVLAVPAGLRASTTVGAIAVPALRVPASLPLPGVLERLRSEHRQLAVVVDEYGGFAGVVTFEDVAEVLVGEILDEDDEAEPQARELTPTSWTLPGRFRIDQVEEVTDLALPEREEYQTVGGLILHALGRTARVGDSVELVLAPQDELPPVRLRLDVLEVERHVPAAVGLAVVPDDAEVAHP